MTEATRSPGRGLAVASALVFALALLGSRPLWDPDEGRYVDVALEMLRDGDWWTPLLHPEVPHLSKPPLTHWPVASSMGAFGRSEWAARLPQALAFAATILAVASVRPAEIAIVGTRPRYSLALYLDCEVESIRLPEDAPDGRPAYRPLSEPLSDELVEQVHGRRIFLVADGRQEAFLDEVRALGFETHEHGRVRRMWLFDDPRRLDEEPSGADGSED